MTPGANADGKRRCALSDKMETEDSLRTVECLRGRLLAERVASRNAKEVAEQMENKLIELEKKFVEESKSRNKAEKKLKFLMKKLESLNISYIPHESEQSGSGTPEKSRIFSIVSSETSSGTNRVEDKEMSANVTNPVIGDSQEFVQNSKPPLPENLQQNGCSCIGNQDSPADGAERSICSSNGEEVEEFKESKSPKASNNSEQNASSFTKNYDNPVAGETTSANNYVNFPELTIQEVEMEVHDKKSESSSVSNYSAQNDGSSAVRDPENFVAGGAIGYGNGVDVPAFTKKEEEIEEFKVNTESPPDSIISELNFSSSPKYHENPAAGETNESRNGVDEKSESSSVSNYSEQNASSSAARDPENFAAGGAIGYSNSVDVPAFTKKKEEIEEFKVNIESPIDSIISEPNSSSSPKDHKDRSAGETNESRNGVDFPELAREKEKIDEFKTKTESPTINQCQGNATHSAKSNQPQGGQKAKKDDHSLRTLFKKEKLNEDNEHEQDDRVDNSLALVPVDLPKTKQRIDPVILDATVKEVLGALRNAKEKLQTSMERRRNNMIKVG